MGMVSLERAREFLHSQGSPVNRIRGEIFANFSSLLGYRNRCCTGSSRNDSPQTDEGRNNNTPVFLGKDIAAEPPKKPRLDLTGISATSKD